jgi:Flp pilus assembly protein TadD
MKRRFIIATLVLCLPLSAQAETRTFVIQKGKVTSSTGATSAIPGGVVASSGKPQVVITDDQKLMFDASKQVMARDFTAAEATYTKVLGMNSGNIEAYLQRGIVRRELGNKTGMASDARTAVSLANAQLQVTPRDPNLYYQRAMGLRLLRQFAQAKQDLRTAMQLSGNTNWETDLKAIELEEKMIVVQ